MTAPATASTGITALMPIRGASSAARITPVPKPPTPLMIAAPMAAAATSARVVASRSNLARHRARLAVAVDGDVGERRLVHLHHHPRVGVALRVHLHVYGDRGVSHLHHLGIEPEQVS